MSKKIKDKSAVLGYQAMKIKFHKKDAYFIFMESHIYALKSSEPINKKVWPSPLQSKDVAIFSAGKDAKWTPIKIIGPFEKEAKEVSSLGILNLMALNISVIQRYEGPRRVNRPAGNFFARHADGVPCIIVK